ncbi:hypothetical protein BJA01nite_72970 [Bradyrhizobium japonicum]|nr:hypothetical protein BJA01nite_72970 [Bradyrhizobium japonicum]GMO56462.1 hypothetical protein BwSF21_78050 [Bradyrhizobium ottawaense]
MSALIRVDGLLLRLRNHSAVSPTQMPSTFASRRSAVLYSNKEVAGLSGEDVLGSEALEV